MSSNSFDHNSLLKDAVAGSLPALQQLLLGHFEVIEAASKACFPKELCGVIDPDDVIQESLVDVYRSIGAYRELDEKCGFDAWLRRIVENRAISLVRHHHRKKRGGDYRRLAQAAGADDSLDSVWEWVFCRSNPPDRPLRVEERRQAVQVCVAQLSDDQRKAVAAHYFEQLTTAEIAQRMNRSPGAVRELLRRAREQLADLLGTASSWLSSR